MTKENPMTVRRSTALIRLASVPLAALFLAACATSSDPQAADVAASAPAMRDAILDLDCGGERAELRFESQEVTLVFDRKAVRVVATPAASGVRWASTVFDDTWVWNKGDQFTVAFRGKELPPCTATERSPKPFVAIIHEPSFHLSIVGGTMTVRRPGADPVEIAVGEPSAHDGDRVWRGSLDDRGLVLRVGGARCRDAMSGMWHPATALLTVGGETYPGCAGDPVDLLAVGEWLVVSIGGEAVAEEPPATIEFLPEGRVGGSGGCNRWNGPFRLGEGLAIGPELRSTMMACAEPVMATERRLLDALPKVNAFDFDDAGRLVLATADGEAIVARRR
jgi:heat shock protein HslJ/membrane-bound inhibitor of C-type lysozyme